MTQASRPSRTLNLGCGRAKLADAINLDVTSATEPDVVHDLNVLPWPFADNSFDRVIARDVIEHLPNTLQVFEELRRICSDGALIEITVPHFSHVNAYTDPTHVRYFGLRSFDYFDAANPLGFYTDARFKKRRCDLIFEPNFANRFVRRLARRNLDRYERRWCWIFPAWYMVIELQAVKA